jgi:outer membrane immunogenic protein
MLADSETLKVKVATIVRNTMHFLFAIRRAPSPPPRKHSEVMMKPYLAAAVVGIALIATAARAADLGYDAPAPVPRASFYNWQGAYVGLNLGYQWGEVTNAPNRPKSFNGGIQLGYNWQYAQFVYGLETDLQLTGADDTVGGLKFSQSWYGTLRGRGGFTFNNVLLYATAGLAYGGLKGEIIGGASESKTLAGWTAGVGMEIGLTPQWTARAEYLYMDLAGRGYAVTGVNNGLESSLLRFGVNYKF